MLKKLVPSLLALAAAASTAQADMVAPGTPVFEDFVLGPTTPGKWGPPVVGTGATITWSIVPAGVAMDSGTSVGLASIFPTGFHAALVVAFSAWSSVANVTFSEVSDSGLAFNAPGATAGDIRISAHPFDGPGGTLAHGFYPPANGSTAAGDIHFDSADTWKIGFGGPGFDIKQVMMHELGHALGLAHTGVAGSLMNPTYTEAFLGPQADDIAGMVYLYGAPVATPDGGATGLLLLVAFGSIFASRTQLRRS